MAFPAGGEDWFHTEQSQERRKDVLGLTTALAKLCPGQYSGRNRPASMVMVLLFAT